MPTSVCWKQATRHYYNAELCNKFLHAGPIWMIKLNKRLLTLCSIHPPTLPMNDHAETLLDACVLCITGLHRKGASSALLAVEASRCTRIQCGEHCIHCCNHHAVHNALGLQEQDTKTDYTSGKDRVLFLPAQTIQQSQPHHSHPAKANHSRGRGRT
jgi:hypothetical protein